MSAFKKTGYIILAILFTIALIVTIPGCIVGCPVGFCNAIGVPFKVPALRDNAFTWAGNLYYGWALLPAAIVAFVFLCCQTPSIYRWFGSKIRENGSGGSIGSTGVSDNASSGASRVSSPSAEAITEPLMNTE